MAVLRDVAKICTGGGGGGGGGPRKIIPPTFAVCASPYDQQYENDNSSDTAALEAAAVCAPLDDQPRGGHHFRGLRRSNHGLHESDVANTPQISNDLVLEVVADNSSDATFAVCASLYDQPKEDDNSSHWAASEAAAVCASLDDQLTNEENTVLRPRLPDELPAEAAAATRNLKQSLNSNSINEWRTLRVATYNPLNLNSPLRLEDISEELKNHDLVGLIGTGCRQRWGEKGATLRGAYYHWGVTADWDRAPYTNKACGVQLLMGKKTFTHKMIRATYLPPPRASQAEG
jgi:hypothetical protein